MRRATPDQAIEIWSASRRSASSSLTLRCKDRWMGLRLAHAVRERWVPVFILLTSGPTQREKRRAACKRPVLRQAVLTGRQREDPRRHRWRGSRLDQSELCYIHRSASAYRPLLRRLPLEHPKETAFYPFSLVTRSVSCHAPQRVPEPCSPVRLLPYLDRASPVFARRHAVAILETPGEVRLTDKATGVCQRSE